MSRSLSFTLAALAGLSSTTTAADSTPILAEGTVVITASDTATTTETADQARLRLGLVPGGTDVISSDVLRQGRTFTLRDALGSSPGVYVQPRAGAEESRLSIRGSGIQRTFHLRGILLLQDGQPINQADGGGDFQAIDPGLVDHIAVYRGANALRYGSATLGGAIDFVSPTGRSRPGTDLRVEGGSFGYLKTQAAGGFVHDEFDGYLAVSQYVSDGSRDWSENANQRAFANVGWRPVEGVENRLYGTFSRSDSQLPGSLTRAQFDDDPTQASAGSLLREVKRDFPLWRLADRLVWDLDDHRLEGGVGLVRKELYHPLSFGEISQDSDDLTGFGRWSWTGTLIGRPSRTTVGANAAWGVTDAYTYGYANASGNRRGPLTSEAEQTARNLEGYAEIQIEAVPSWWAIAGLQVAGHHRRFEDRFLANGDQSDSKLYTGTSPKLGVLWQASETITGFANISRSFEPPTFAEWVQAPAFGVPSFPYDDLKAQSAWTLEVGSRGARGPVAWDIAAYYAAISDEYLAYQVNPGVQNTLNADDTIHLGIELGLQVELAHDLLRDDDRVILGTTWTWGRFTFDDDVVYGDNTIPGIAEHIARIELRWESRGWFAGLTVDWQSDWYVDFANTTEAEGEALLGLRGGYTSDYGVSWFAEARNLADTAYVATSGVANPSSPPTNQALYNPGDGRAFTVGIQWVQ